MMRIALILLCLIPLFSWSQDDSTSVEAGSIVLDPDFVPLKQDGRWVWYDIVNEKASDSIYISDFAEQESGVHWSYVLKDSSHWGALNYRGDTVCAFAYDSLIFVDNKRLTKFNDQWSYHYYGEFAFDSLIPISFDSLFFDGADIYLFDQGKTGMILSNGTVIEAKYDGIHEFSCDYGYRYERFFMSLNGVDYNLLNEQGEELLPSGVWDLRCTEDGVFEFRRGNNPEFYIPDWYEFIKPNGRDIVFYGSDGYKIYNDEKTKSELHLRNGRVLKDQYDDYFPLLWDFIVIRKNGKVGLTGGGKQVLGEIAYDQISSVLSRGDWIEHSKDYFKFYIGDSCGLMDKNGNVLFDAAYANILCTADDNRFIVLDNNLSGIVDRKGKTIIPVEYELVEYEKGANLFVVEHLERIGLFNYNGKQRTPIEYEGYGTLQNFQVGNYRDGLLVLRKGEKYYFANSKGFIDENGFDHYNYSQEVLKTYDSKAISVFLFDQKGQIEDRSNYPIFRNAIVRKNYSKSLGGISPWDISTLEENQAEGYFGLRWVRQRGFGVEPQYRTVRAVGFSDYFGYLPASGDNYALTNSTSAEIVSAANHLQLGSGKTDSRKYFSTDMPIIRTGSGDRFINRSVDGWQHRSYSYSIRKASIGLADKVQYSDLVDPGDNYRRYFKGGEVEICPIESADVSFYKYFSYFNATDGLRVSPSDMKLILNPKLGVKFKNSESDIINASAFDFFKKVRTYLSVKTFEEFYYLNASVFYERPLETECGSLRLKRIPNIYDGESMVENVLEASLTKSNFVSGRGETVLAKVKTNELAKIHVDYPNYFFQQDSINLSYEAGRITRRMDSNTVQLVLPDGKIVADSCIMIRYLNEECFALYRSSGWGLVDKDGNQLSDVLFGSVSEFKENRADFKLKDGTALEINSKGEKLMALPAPRMYLDEDHYYFAAEPNTLINRFSEQRDEILDGEKYQGKGFFTSKEDGKTMVRRFGSSKTVKLKSTPSLKSFGSCIYFKNGKHIFAIDSNLQIKKFKKSDQFRVVTPEIGWLEGKTDQLLDTDWNYICKMNKDQSFELRDGDLVVLEGDSIVQNYGSLKPISEDQEMADLEPEVKVFSEDGKYGIMRGEEEILPLNYPWLSKINDREFMTRTTSENRLYDGGLKRIGDRPFDGYIETSKGNFVFFYNDQVYVFSVTDEIKMIR
ncbi:MAG: WG repeat-containing protein [Crocinitomicaceae bacterium]|nr:WG repeat-containing protein [Crocinitomicaceae bacterium]